MPIARARREVRLQQRLRRPAAVRCRRVHAGGQAEAADAKVRLADTKAAAAREQQLLAQSGVTAQPELEYAVAPAGAGPRVRIATTTSSGDSFAACRADERLIGGGCSADNKLVSSYPSNYGPDDTVGARWKCKGGNEPITAYALCAKLPAP
jgi:hypothetical protein